MPELTFEVLDARPARHAAAPTLRFRLLVTQGPAPRPVQSVALQCQIRIATRKRHYEPAEQARLTDLFGEPARWGETLHSMLWTQTTTTVPPFEKSREFELPVPCSFDFNVAATKYFHGLADGHVPLEFLFSGSVFYRTADGSPGMDLISWNKEAAFELPVSTWQDLMEIYYPNRNWLCLNRQVFDALLAYKQRHGYTGFDEALTSLLPDGKRAAS